MAKPIYRYVPHWMYSELDNRYCQKCGESIKRENIIAIGIRQSGKNASLYMEHKCSKCNYREMTNFSGKNESTLEELCYSLLDAIKSQKDVEKSKILEHSSKNPSSLISDEEMKNVLNFIRSVETHEEFLKYIKADKFKGIDDEQSHPKN